MISNLKPEFSFCSWYSHFKEISLKATILQIPDNILKYLEYDAFLLPLEAIKEPLSELEWNDGSVVVEDEDSGYQPTFPEFSKCIQDVIDVYGAVFIKSNWSSPSDAAWVAPTKSLKCKTLEEVYLLLKSSNRIADDLSTVKCYSGSNNDLRACLVMKQWRDINPCTEYRCFVIEDELIGISQRDISQYYTYNDIEKYDIQADIQNLFTKYIKGKFSLTSYTFDVIRYKKNKVKIVDFGALDNSTTEGTLFTYDELYNHINNIPEFRYIGEEIGVQPKNTTHFCVPEEINKYFQSSNENLINAIQKEIENQKKEQDKLSCTDNST